MTLEEAVNGLQFKSSRDLAMMLAEKGIKGKKSHWTQCPLAKYIKEETGEDVRVTQEYIVATKDFLITPLPLIRFIQRFDHGDFPDLIEGE